MIDLAGIYPPIPTPFDSDERLALDRLEHNLSRWLNEPLDGIVMPGSNSEAAYLTREERLQVWQTCAAALRGTDKKLIAGTGAETTLETIQLTEQAAELGAAAALVLPPFFYKPAMKDTVLIQHYQALADASPIPLLVYNVPAFTGIDFAPETVITLAEHFRIIGMKDSSVNVVKTARVLAARPGFQVFAGTGSAVLPFLSIGAVGTISALANIAARPLRAMLDAFQAGQLAAAREIQLALAELNTAITARYGVPGLKYAMDRLGYYGGPTRRPLLPLDPKARADIDRLVAALNARAAL